MSNSCYYGTTMATLKATMHSWYSVAIVELYNRLLKTIYSQFDVLIVEICAYNNIVKINCT